MTFLNNFALAFLLSRHVNDRIIFPCSHLTEVERALCHYFSAGKMSEDDEVSLTHEQWTELYQFVVQPHTQRILHTVDETVLDDDWYLI